MTITVKFSILKDWMDSKGTQWDVEDVKKILDEQGWTYHDLKHLGRLYFEQTFPEFPESRVGRVKLEETLQERDMFKALRLERILDSLNQGRLYL